MYRSIGCKKATLILKFGVQCLERVLLKNRKGLTPGRGVVGGGCV